MTSRNIWIGLVGVLAVAAFGYWYAGDGKTVKPVPDSTRSHQIEPSNAEPIETAVTKTVDINASPSSDAKSEVEYEIVHGLEVRKDRNCTVTLNYITAKDGTTKEAYSCEPNKPSGQDNYDTYTNETLQTLAYSDSHAAHVLSKPLYQSDPKKALQFAIRSTALSGDTLPINWIAQNYPLPYKQNGKVIIQTVEDRFVMSGIIQTLGSEVNNHESWERRAIQHQSDGINLESLNARIKDLLAEMDEIRNQVGVD